MVLSYDEVYFLTLHGDLEDLENALSTPKRLSRPHEELECSGIISLMKCQKPFCVSFNQDCRRRYILWYYKKFLHGSSLFSPSSYLRPDDLAIILSHATTSLQKHPPSSTRWKNANDKLLFLSRLPSL